MFIASFHNTQKNLKVKAKPTVVEQKAPAPLLTLPQPKVRFINKANLSTKTLREERSETTKRVREVLAATSALVPNDKDRGMPMGAIITDVARQFGTSVEDIKGKCRARLIVAIRHHAMARIWVSQKDKISFPMLGRAFRVDHTTVIHALRKTGLWSPGGGNRIQEATNKRIVELYETGLYTNEEIAIMCRCSGTYVGRFMKNEANQS